MRKMTLLLLCLWINASQTLAETATIASASNFRATLLKLVSDFENKHPHQIKLVTAATGILFNQITHGAPFDVFLAADTLRPMQLAKNGAGLGHTRFTYALGRLAFAFNPQITSPLPDNKKSALDIFRKNTGKIAIANPQTAPYGIAAKQCFHYLFKEQHKLSNKTQAQLVRGANINQAYQYLVTGNANLGFVALSQLVNSQNKLRYWIVPSHWHEPIRQQAILLQSGADNKAAISFMLFLKTTDAKKIIQHNGYSTLFQ
ncbi:MAG: molybdate ABC transporter substrate-binding protein [Spongiibacteraceae bacterium]|nr:molybdate ABC transporter substrate-binding protein [Spongiibacteraceae bacterium]